MLKLLQEGQRARMPALAIRSMLSRHQKLCSTWAVWRSCQAPGLVLKAACAGETPWPPLHAVLTFAV